MLSNLWENLFAHNSEQDYKVTKRVTKKNFKTGGIDKIAFWEKERIEQKIILFILKTISCYLEYLVIFSYKDFTILLVL